MENWHAQSEKQVLEKLKTREEGLHEEEVEQRLREYGPNKIAIERKISPLQIFLNQFKNLPVLLLIAAALVSLLLAYFDPVHAEEESLDSILIFTILIANAFFGFYQEYKAEKSIEALKKLAAPRACVLRNGKEEDIAVEEVVPGDILILREGDRIAADARVIESISLHCDESALTGESVPVEKRSMVLKESTALAERRNMIYTHTAVTRGKGKAVVVATALQTEIGKIAREIAEADEKVTPFQKEVEDIGKKIAIAVFGIVIIVALTEIALREGDVQTILITAISLAVAAIPEGLPAVVTLALAIGTNRMVRQHALMRRLATVQNLGSIDIICTDKTGTLTENIMTVTTVYFNGHLTQVTGTGHEVNGGLICEGGKCDRGEFEILMACATLCNDAKKIDGAFRGHEDGASSSSPSKSIGFRGDPTEIAILIPVYKAGHDPETIRGEAQKMGELPFSSERKRMTTVYEYKKTNTAFMKGAPEIVLERCTQVYQKGKIRKLTAEDRNQIIETNNAMASRALRVLGFAYKPGVEGKEEVQEEAVETGMVFLGLMGMIDPPRPGVREALDECRTAGIRVVMITGDNRLTAEAVGKELGLGGRSLNGEELDKLSEEDLKKAVETVGIYARTSPKHKTMILKALKENRHIVAMTGDGVNDAPAIKNSDVGIAMGIRGTEVAKEASDMVLLDDNFVTIRNAIAEGRGIFDNIRKFVVYLVGANLAEVLVVFLVAISGWGLALLAAHLLWINLLTDGLPALALGVDPPAKGIMQRTPRKIDDRVINADAFRLILAISIAATLSILWIFSQSLEDLQKAQTLTFTAFVLYEMVKVFVVRSRYGTPLLSNKWLYIAVASSLLLQLAVLYTPLSTYFKVVPLSLADWELLGVGLLGYGVLVIILLKAEEIILFRKIAF